MKFKPEPLAIAKRNWIKLIVSLVVLIALVISFYIGIDYSGKSSFCANCHAMQPYVKSWSTGTHKKTACVECHQEPGMVGALTQRADILKQYGVISLYFQRQRPALTATISTAGCLKCHEAILTSTVLSTGGVKVSHKAIVGAGLNCGRCHARTGHSSKAAKAARPMHDYCFSCHRTPKTGSNCTFCHTRDVGDKGPKQIDSYSKVDLDLNKCDSCHTTATCPICHPGGRQVEVY